MALDKRKGIIGAVLGAVTAVGAALFLLSGPTTYQVPEGASLQEYINKASTGDILQLANATYIGNFTDNKGLNILGPAVIKTPNADPTIYYPPGTPPATLKNIEITTSSGQVYDIVRYGTWGSTQDTFDKQPQGLTLDNVYIHGQPGQEVQRGIAANGRNFSLTNSKVIEVHGKGYDSQAICVWNGSGPFLIENNELQAPGEVILVGGADASIPNLVPSNGTIRRNHVWKPLEWRGVWTAKNLIEIKNGGKWVIDGNVLENSWGDAQIGFGVLFTVRNQDGTNPWATVEDISFTNNQLLNVAGGFQVIGKDWPNVSAQGSRIRIANNIIRLAQAGAMGPNGRLLQLERSKDVTFENNDANPDHTFVNFAGADLQTGLIYRKNLLTRGQYGITGDGVTDKAALDKYATGYDFSVNTIITPWEGAAAVYPTGNTFVTSRPDPVPAGIGVDIVALQAAINGTGSTPTPTPSSTIVPSPSATVSVVPTPSLPSSADNTRIPTSTKIVDDSNGVWTLSGTKMLRNGQETGGFGSALLWCSHKIYGLGEDFKWWQYTNPGWSLFGTDPCPQASPSPTAVPTSTATPIPTVSPTPTPSPSPQPSPTSLPFCPSGTRPGNPPTCRCRNGFLGGSGKCK